jgi:hypothetical protein
MSWIVNESTSVIQIDGSTFSGDAIVYVSTSTIPDHFVTVLDQTGYFSTGRTILLSTNNTTFADGTTSRQIAQSFGYLSLVATAPAQWSIVNQDPFSEPVDTLRVLNSRAIDLSSVYTSTISTTGFSATYMTLSSIVSGPATTGGANLNQSGSIVVSGGAKLRTTTAPSLAAKQLDGTIVECTSVSVTGDMNASGTISLDSLATSSLNVVGMFVSTAQGVPTVSSSITVALTTSTMNTNRIDVQNLNLADTSITYNTGWNISPIAPSSLYITTLTSPTIHTSSIYAGAIGGAISSIEMTAAAILNPTGSMITDTVIGNRLQATNLDTNSVAASSINTSSISMNNRTSSLVTLNLVGRQSVLNASWSISANTLQAGSLQLSTCSAVSSIVTRLTAKTAIISTFMPTTFVLENQLNIGGTAFDAPEAVMTGASVVAPVMKTPRITVQTIAAENVYSDQLTVSSLNAANTVPQRLESLQISTAVITANQIFLGIPISAPIRILSDSSFNMPFQRADGSGSYVNPFTTFNTQPTEILFSLDSRPRYLNMKIVHTNAAAGPGGLLINVNGHIFYDISNSDGQSYTESYIDFDLSGYPMIGQNPLTNDDTPYVLWRSVPSVTTDQLTLWVSTRPYGVDRASPSIVNGDGGLFMNRAAITWPFVDGVTIENQYNDIQTRSLFYSGSLRHVSDRAVKKNIGDADLAQCVSSIQNIPLRRYEYNGIVSRDKTRLGILTTELANPFPKSVGVEEVLGANIQVASVDQLKMAHLGTTKWLIQEVERLRYLSNLCSLVEVDV